MFPPVLTRRGTPWIGVVLALVSMASVVEWVDLTPRVEGEFFFADDDPQLAASRVLRERFHVGEQVILRVADPEAGPEAPAAERPGYVARIEALGDALASIDGVSAIYSVATHDPDQPLYGRILRTPDPAATNVILQVEGADPTVLVPRLEAVVEGLRGDLDVVLSGAPVIIELIRRNLLRDLIVFTTAAVALLALLIGALYRDPAIVVGMLATGTVAVSTTLLLVRALGVAIGLLTANLATIVFVLTLSHMAFITANVRRALADPGSATGPATAPGGRRAAATVRGVRQTFEGSFWGMTTTCLGFLSLLVATARPLRELGTAGAIGAVLALAAAYLVYPAFLARWAGRRRVATADPPPAVVPAPARGANEGVLRARVRAGSGRRTRWPLIVVAAAVTGLALGVVRLDTDPSLLSYFAPGTELREGLERIDADGGSSPLQVAVRDDGGRIDTEAAYDKLTRLRDSLDRDPHVGVVLGPSVLIDQARTIPLARFLPISVLLDIASSPRLNEVALGFVSADRSLGLVSLRMRESVATASRDSVLADIAGAVEAAGLEPVRIAGLYDLQARLGHLIRESLVVGIGGLLVLFLGVAAVVSRSVGTTLRMWACLTGIPLVVLGTFGWLGIAIDIITSPAANVALAVGVDSMIHLVVRVRRFTAAGVAAPWSEALDRVRAPVLAATGILAAGFGIFVLSSFPPTRRFGLAVILGTLTAAVLALVVLPRIAAGPRRRTETVAS